MTNPLFPISINIKENKNKKRLGRPARLGIPFPCGIINTIEELQLYDDVNNPIPYQASVTASWHDESIRWILLDFNASVDAKKQCIYTLDKVGKDRLKTKNKFEISFKESDQVITINTGNATFEIDKIQFKPFNTIFIKNQKIDFKNFKFNLTNSEIISYKPIIDKITLPQSNETLKSTIYFEGHFENSNSEYFLNFKSNLSFFSGSSMCELEFTLHNPNRAMHLGGFWDLGDEGSEFFKSLTLDLNFTKTKKISWKNENANNWESLPCDNIRLYQDSSGGDHWNHHIHIDKDNKSTVSFRGYQLKINDEVIQSGNRVSPLFSIKNNKKHLVKAYIKQFWENFPKAISTQKNQLSLELFPETQKSDYELQGGEQKTHSIFLDFETNDNKLEELILHLNLTLPISHYSKANAMQGLPEEFIPNELDLLINQGIEGDNNFFIKREKADEYGWRNFGELWADHETLEHGNDASLVSHYNNQYDPIYGFLKQYLLSGDERWFELADDLAKHVIDIDIYHTDQDRPEYNHGLFWHTDHYLGGQHCTHRTFSKTHLEIDHVEQSGGGPGAEHCYSAGILFNYFMTGDNKCLHATLNTIEWSHYPNEGNDTIIEHLFKFIKTDLKKIILIKNGEHLFDQKFPLTRGTGNYISTLIDANQLKNNTEYLKKAAKIIQGTISSKDILVERNLINDIENNWHYTVLLQSVIKFLSQKEKINEIDTDYFEILSSFKHYAHWVLNNEKPYLDNAKNLSYPNDTWIAQDIRKATILYAYQAYCEPELKEQLQVRVLFFQDYIYKEFSSPLKLKTTRILALLMQSNQFHCDNKNLNISSILKTDLSDSKSTQLTTFKIISSFIQELFKRIWHINIKQEILWIKFRCSK